MIVDGGFIHIIWMHGAILTVNMYIYLPNIIFPLLAYNNVLLTLVETQSKQHKALA